MMIRNKLPLRRGRGSEPEPQHVVDGDEITSNSFKGNNRDESEPIPGDDCEAIIMILVMRSKKMRMSLKKKKNTGCGN